MWLINSGDLHSAVGAFLRFLKHTIRDKSSGDVFAKYSIDRNWMSSDFVLACVSSIFQRASRLSPKGVNDEKL